MKEGRMHYLEMNPPVAKAIVRKEIIDSITTACKKRDDAILWAEIYPPNDVRKRDAVRDWQRSVVERWVDTNPWKEW